jgi:hypothetical protein
MYEKNTGKTVFFPFSFFPIFGQICFLRHWTLCVGKKLAKSLGVLGGVTPKHPPLGGVSKPIFQFSQISLDVMWQK